MNQWISKYSEQIMKVTARDLQAGDKMYYGNNEKIIDSICISKDRQDVYIEFNRVKSLVIMHPHDELMIYRLVRE